MRKDAHPLKETWVDYFLSWTCLIHACRGRSKSRGGRNIPRKAMFSTTLPGISAANDPMESTANHTSNPRIKTIRIPSQKILGFRRPSIITPQPVITPPSTALRGLLTASNPPGMPSSGQFKISNSNSQSPSPAGWDAKLAVSPVIVVMTEAAFSQRMQ